MTKYYLSYFWKNGAPYGKSPVDQIQQNPDTSYRILSDPYRKRISVEQYIKNRFEKLVYDSALLDFRKLNPEFQNAWEKEQISDACSLVRDQDDRIVVKEVHRFDGNLCRECKLYSPHGVFLGSQYISYTSQGDTFNGVTLFDSLHKQVVKKEYSVDEETGNFYKLIKETSA